MWKLPRLSYNSWKFFLAHHAFPYSSRHRRLLFCSRFFPRQIYVPYLAVIIYLPFDYGKDVLSRPVQLFYNRKILFMSIDRGTAEYI